MLNLTTPVIDKIKTALILTMLAALIALAVWIAYLKLATIPKLEGDIRTLNETIKTKEALIGMQNIGAELNAVDETKLAQVPIRMERVTREMVPVYREIEKWREANVTHECNCSGHLYGFDFVGVFNAAMLAPDRESQTEVPVR